MKREGTRTARGMAVACACVAAGIGMAAFAGAVRAQAPAAPQPPIQISAEAAEYFNKEGRVVFTGNVVATQGDTVLTSQRMEVMFSQPAAPEGERPGGSGEPAAGRKVSQIVALDSVTLRQVDAETKKERFATGEKGVYDAEQRLVTMTGNPRLWEGKNVLVGEQIVFHLDDKNVNVKGKVNLTVFPDETKEPKKP